MTGPQGGGGSFNFTDAIDTHTDYVVWMLKTMREQGTGIVDVRKEPEDAYAEHCREADIRTRRCATASRTTTATATRSRAASPTTGGRKSGMSFASQPRRTLEPYVFDTVPADGGAGKPVRGPHAALAEAMD